MEVINSNVSSGQWLHPAMIHGYRRCGTWKPESLQLATATIITSRRKRERVKREMISSVQMYQLCTVVVGTYASRPKHQDHPCRNIGNVKPPIQLLERPL